MDCVGYMRTSSQVNVGDDKDSEKRQLRAIKSYCKNTKLFLKETFYDAGVSGSKELKDRPALLNAINYCLENNITKIVVENSDRFSRSLLQQEVMLMTIASKGISVLCCDNDKFSDVNESNVMFRQIGGAFNQYQRSLLVNRLAQSRNNKKIENKKKRLRKYTTLDGNGKCEGAPQYYVNVEAGKYVNEIKKMYQRKTHSLRQISAHMFHFHKLVNKNGNMLSAAQISRIVKYKPLRGK